MGTQNKGARYQSISFDKQFIAEIKDHIKDKREYRSIADFSREAIREKMHKESKPVIIKGTLDKKINQLEQLTGKKYEIQCTDEGDQLIEILIKSQELEEIIPVIDKKINNATPKVGKKLDKRVDKLENKVDEILTILKSKNNKETNNNAHGLS